MREAKKDRHKNIHFGNILCGLLNFCPKKYQLYLLFNFSFQILNLKSNIQTKADLGRRLVSDLEYTLKLIKNHKVSKKF
jgi:hypothetical protein